MEMPVSFVALLAFPIADLTKELVYHGQENPKRSKRNPVNAIQFKPSQLIIMQKKFISTQTLDEKKVSHEQNANF